MNSIADGSVMVVLQKISMERNERDGPTPCSA